MPKPLYFMAKRLTACPQHKRRVIGVLRPLLRMGMGEGRNRALLNKAICFRKELIREGIITAESLPNLLLWSKAVNLNNPNEVWRAIKDIEDLKLKADVLCVDTLFASSAGANLTLAEELLPVLAELQKLMEALGAKTCLLVHHTNKKSEEYYGTIAFLATIEALILFKAKDKTTLTVECLRIRDGEKFKPFELKLQKVKLKTLPDKFGREEQETMAVAPGVTQRPTQKDEDLDFMEWVLAVQLANRATYAQWRDEVIRLTPQKKDKTTGETRPGISEKTFDRRLEVIVEERHHAALSTHWPERNLFHCRWTVWKHRHCQPSNCLP